MTITKYPGLLTELQRLESEAGKVWTQTEGPRFEFDDAGWTAVLRVRRDKRRRWMTISATDKTPRAAADKLITDFALWAQVQP